MTKNPYDVLGVPQNASDDDIKKAYRDLTRKYHPDANVNNPLADLAEEKFKEVQEAYDMIMKEREHGSGSYNYGYGNYQQSNAGTNDVEMQAAVNFINNRRFRDALNVLNRMPNRNSQWYYLSGVANMGMGNNVLAREHAAQAVNMEPHNPQYQQLLNQLNWTSRQYQSNPYGNGYGGTPGNSTCGTGNMCCDLWIMDSLCECMGGDLCACM